MSRKTIAFWAMENLKHIYSIMILEKSIFEKCYLYHAVPLGSIQELAADSCSEIKASEGNEMVNGDYWIYSDGNGQIILARCEGTAIWFVNKVHVVQTCSTFIKIINKKVSRLLD